ncbi:RNA-directed DNA polymerase [Cupriavidus basilensis]
MNRLLSRGYFPTELPPPFQTVEYAKFIAATPPTAQPYVFAGGKTPNYVSRPCTYNLARAGSLRRVLSIPNPINFYQLASVVSANWSTLNKHYNKSLNALSRPKVGLSIPFRNRRAYEWTGHFRDIPERRASIRAGMRYSLAVDIKAFYPSVYTHSLAWALHTKEKAQSNVGYDDLLANRFDRLIQNAQSKQTKGIPVGPDTSFLMAELLLSTIDVDIKKRIGKRYFRYLDDYEFCFRTATEADTGLSLFQEIIGKFELNANEVKTKIEELPALLDNAWVRQIRPFDIDSQRLGRQKSDLFDFFNLSIEMWKQYPQEAVIRYAVAKTTSTPVSSGCWQLYQQLLCQWAMAEPAVLPVVLDILLIYKKNGSPIDLDMLGELLNNLVAIHAPRGHTSEVAWVIWAHLLFSINITTAAGRTVCKMDNPIIALLALHAKNNKLLSANSNLKLWQGKMTSGELTGENWLLAYEARIKKWLGPATTKEYVKTTVGFADLGKAGVSFYDAKKVTNYSPGDFKLLTLKNALLAASYA